MTERITIWLNKLIEPQPIHLLQSKQHSNPRLCAARDDKCIQHLWWIRVDQEKKIPVSILEERITIHNEATNAQMINIVRNH